MIRQFFIVISLALLLSLPIHYYFFELHADFSVFGVTYLSVFISTVVIVLLIYKASKKYFNQVGFLFLGGSFLKFALYFVLLKPLYNLHDIPKNKAFILFFIPYGISLIIEAIFVAKLLQNQNPKP